MCSDEALDDLTVLGIGQAIPAAGNTAMFGPLLHLAATGLGSLKLADEVLVVGIHATGVRNNGQLDKPPAHDIAVTVAEIRPVRATFSVTHCAA